MEFSVLVRQHTYIFAHVWDMALCRQALCRISQINSSKYSRPNQLPWIPNLLLERISLSVERWIGEPEDPFKRNISDLCPNNYNHHRQGCTNGHWTSLILISSTHLHKLFKTIYFIFKFLGTWHLNRIPTVILKIPRLLFFKVESRTSVTFK